MRQLTETLKATRHLKRWRRPSAAKQSWDRQLPATPPCRAIAIILARPGGREWDDAGTNICAELQARGKPGAR